MHSDTLRDSESLPDDLELAIETHQWVMESESLPELCLWDLSFASVIHPWANRRGQINDRNYPESCYLHIFASFFSDVSLQSRCHLSFYLGWFSVSVGYSLRDIKAAQLIKDTQSTRLVANLLLPTSARWYRSSAQRRRGRIVPIRQRASGLVPYCVATGRGAFRGIYGGIKTLPLQTAVVSVIKVCGCLKVP